MHHRMERRVELNHQTLTGLQSQLRMLNPMAVLGRGYTLTRKADGTVIRSAHEVRVGDRITTRFAEGKVVSNVEEIE